MKLKELNLKRQELLLKINQLESDLKKPLKMDLDANALEEENREILNGLYRIEKENLQRIDAEIESIHFSRSAIGGQDLT